MTTTPPGDLLTRNEAVTKYGVSLSTLQRWITSGRLTAHRNASGRVFVSAREMRRETELRAEQAAS